MLQDTATYSQSFSKGTEVAWWVRLILGMIYDQGKNSCSMQYVPLKKFYACLAAKHALHCTARTHSELPHLPSLQWAGSIVKCNSRLSFWVVSYYRCYDIEVQLRLLVQVTHFASVRCLCITGTKGMLEVWVPSQLALSDRCPRCIEGKKFSLQAASCQGTYLNCWYRRGRVTAFLNIPGHVLCEDRKDALTTTQSLMLRILNSANVPNRNSLLSICREAIGGRVRQQCVCLDDGV